MITNPGAGFRSTQNLAMDHYRSLEQDVKKIIHGTGTVPGQTSDADPCMDKYQKQTTDFRSTIVILKINPIFL